MADGNDENEFDYLKTVKVLLEISDDSADEILQIYIAQAEQGILNYCNIKQLPSALHYTLCQIVVDLYRENTALNKSGAVVGNVSSISEDGRTVSFSGVESLKVQMNDKITRLTELNRYRKLYKV